MPEISLLPSDSAVTNITIFWHWGLAFFPCPCDSWMEVNHYTCQPATVPGNLQWVWGAKRKMLKRDRELLAQAHNYNALTKQNGNPFLPHKHTPGDSTGLKGKLRSLVFRVSSSCHILLASIEFHGSHLLQGREEMYSAFRVSESVVENCIPYRVRKNGCAEW